MNLKKTSGIILGLLFITFAVVQYNDPDPYLWMLIYGVAAVICFLYAFNRLSIKVLGISTVFFAFGGVLMWPSEFQGFTIGNGDIKNIEEGRESFGLFLCSVSFLGFFIAEKLKSRKSLQNNSRV